MKLNYRRKVGLGFYLCIFTSKIDNFGQERIMMSGGLDNSSMKNHLDLFYMLHGTLSYGIRMRYKNLVRCDFEIFVALILFIDCIIFSIEKFHPDPIRGI